MNFETAQQVIDICGGRVENIDLADRKFGVKITARDCVVKIEGSPLRVREASEFFRVLATAKKQGLRIASSDFKRMLERAHTNGLDAIRQLFDNPLVIELKRKSIVPKNLSQKKYLQNIAEHEITFGIGPAGTGKTYLAVASAIKKLQNKEVERIILTRPAVEAGEALGFLPGDLQEKLLPYLRPLYDAMADMLGLEESARLMEKGVIEIAPLAYMRGRTLSNAFVILDEAQNTTNQQMMMFLTRLGENSRMVVTGDITQIDLPNRAKSGLKGAIEVLANIEGIKIFSFDANDVVRHPLVTKIVNAYAKHQTENA